MNPTCSRAVRAVSLVMAGAMIGQMRNEQSCDTARMLRAVSALVLCICFVPYRTERV